MTIHESGLFLRGPSCPWWLTPLLISPNSCHDLGVKILTVLAVPLALALPALAADCRKNQPKTEATLIELEQNWAAVALSRKDADAVACMVADEFEDANVDGSLHTRSQMLERIANRESARKSEISLDVRADSPRWWTLQAKSWPASASPMSSPTATAAGRRSPDTKLFSFSLRPAARCAPWCSA